MKTAVFIFAGGVFLFSLPPAAPVFYPLGVCFLGMAFASSFRVREETHLKRDESGRIVWTGPEGERLLEPSEIVSVIQDPSRGQLVLTLKDGTKAVFPRKWENMQVLGTFLTPLDAETPLFLKLRQSLHGFLVYSLFILILFSVVAAAYLTPDTPAWVQYFSLLLALPALTIAFHLAFSFPLWWIISSESIQVISLLRTKTWNRSRLREFRTDRYLYAGDPYFLIRFGFGRKALVIDEYSLRDPLYRYRTWILTHWSV